MRQVPWASVSCTLRFRDPCDAYRASIADFCLTLGFPRKAAGLYEERIEKIFHRHTPLVFRCGDFTGKAQSALLAESFASFHLGFVDQPQSFKGEVLIHDVNSIRQRTYYPSPAAGADNLRLIAELIKHAPHNAVDPFRFA